MTTERWFTWVEPLTSDAKHAIYHFASESACRAAAQEINPNYVLQDFLAIHWATECQKPEQIK
jgi:hypothetical protein